MSKKVIIVGKYLGEQKLVMVKNHKTEETYTLKKYKYRSRCYKYDSICKD